MKISEKQRKEIYNSTDKMIEKIEKSMNEIKFCCSRKDFWKMTNADRIREMSNEELAYILSDIKGDYVDIEALKVSTKALKKQIPQKILYEDIGYNQYENVNVYACICPSCGLHIIEFDDNDVSESDSDEPKKMFHSCMVHHAYMGLNNFCNRCGQKLDWSDTD